MRRPRPVAIATAALLVSACGAYTVSFRDKEPFAPLPIYAGWWEQTEACAERIGDLLAIEWYTAASITSDGLVARGLWSPPHEIVIVRGYEEDEVTVRHEMLHDLLSGDADHTSPLWKACDLIPD
jgi:hypothetical protein